ncbi:nucleoside-diphosphate kinase [Candidatus Woesearchaeota archaeon]|nr:nucleoside-diphosphate kinase [Candidatus Woesearchaeota archaeon]
MIERTLVLIKPDGVRRGLIGKIIMRFEDAGLKIVGMKMVWIDKDFAKKHYSEHVGKDFYSMLEEFITSGPVVAMVIEGVEAVEVVRKIVGPTEPKTAPPGTIRGDFAHHSARHADKHKKAVQNLIHASGTREEAEKEIALWFNPEEIHSYKTVHELHTF